jgi:hypothetical protein
MTMAGSGAANAPMRSIPPSPSTASSSSATIASMRGRSAATRLGVNALLTSPRSRV